MGQLSRRAVLQYLAALPLGAYILRPRPAFARVLLRRSGPPLPASIGVHPSQQAPVRRADHLRATDDAAHSWNWLDSHWWLQFAPVLSYPFNSSNQLGIPVNESNCRPEDGWELYTRRILTIDAEPVPVQGISAVPVDRDRFFALYNRYSGILRIFHYVPQPAALNSRYAVSFYASLNGKANPTTTHPYFALMGGVSEDALNATYQSENRIVQYIESATAGWIVSDLMLSYNESGRNAPLYLSWEVSILSTAVLSLGGRMAVRVPVPPASESWLTRVVSVAGSVAKAAGSASGNAADIRATSGKLTDLARRAGEGGQADLSGLLTTAAQVLAGASGPIAAALAGTQVLRSVVSLFRDSGSASFTTYEGTLQLEGELSFEPADHASQTMPLEEPAPRPVGPPTVSSHTPREVPAYNRPDVPYFHKLKPGQRLGLLALAEAPRVTWYLTYGARSVGVSGGAPFALAYSIPQAPEFRINPDAGVQLVSVEVQVVLEAPNCRLCLAPGVAREVSPTDAHVCNIYRDSFGPVVPGASTPLIDSGFEANGDQSLWMAALRDQVFVRFSLVLRKASSGETMSWLLTFPANADLEVQGIDKNLYSRYPNCSS